MTFRVPRDAHGVEPMPELVHQPQQREAIMDLASVFRISPHDEEVTDPGGRATVE